MNGKTPPSRIHLRGVQWLSGRVLASVVKGRGFETYLRRAVSLSKTLYSPKVLVIPRKRRLRPDMTEKLLTGTLSLNTKHLFELCRDKTCFRGFPSSGLYYYRR